jgi:KipI family sensor histidine kinase inhibitor
MTARLLTCGEHAVLVEVDGLREVLALDDAVRAAIAAGDAAFAGVVDVVPAARTVLVVVEDGGDLASVRDALPRLASQASAPPTPSHPRPTDRAEGGHYETVPPERQPPVTEIRVHYDGPDLREICELTGLRTAEVVAAHTQTAWRVAFSGFAPGFAYLCGGDSRLQVPRRSEPRTSVPAGSVALAGEFSAVYPRSSPGGWQLLGHTEAVMWDVERKPPALLQPGSTVRFVDADTTDETTDEAADDTDRDVASR